MTQKEIVTMIEAGTAKGKELRIAQLMGIGGEVHGMICYNPCYGIRGKGVVM